MDSMVRPRQLPSFYHDLSLVISFRWGRPEIPGQLLFLNSAWQTSMTTTVLPQLPIWFTKICVLAPYTQQKRPEKAPLLFLLYHCRNQAEMAHTCRGTINLANAVIHTEDSTTIVISNGGTQTFHLKAATEVERQKWIMALELAKTEARKMVDAGKFAVFCLFPSLMQYW